MDRISGLSDELLVKILSFVPTKEVVSTSVLSKRWESLWLWVPKLDFEMNRNESDVPIRDFITKNLPLLKPPVLESFRLQCTHSSFQPEDIKHWVETSVSRCVRELNINFHDYLYPYQRNPVKPLPSSLYTCKSLVTLKLKGRNITVDVPRILDLPSLKTLKLCEVTYSKRDALQLLLMHCPVLEDLVIDRAGFDNMTTIVITVPSLLRLALPLKGESDSDGYVIVTPSLKYFKVTRYDTTCSHFLAHMPNVEVAHIAVEGNVEKLFESITSVKRLSLSLSLNDEDEIMYRKGIVFDLLEHLELRIRRDYWAKSLVRLLEDSPQLRVLKILRDIDPEDEFESPSWNNDDYVVPECLLKTLEIFEFAEYRGRLKEEYETLSWYNDQSSIPKCLLKSLETFEFARYKGKQEEKDFVSYILKNTRHLKPLSIKH